MITYYVEHRDQGGMFDFSKKDTIMVAENLDNLRRNLIAKYVTKSIFSNTLHPYDGRLYIFVNNTSRYLGTLLFNKKDGRAYWTKPGALDFYYPVSAKTGRISGEGWDYFRPPSKTKRRA